MEEAKPGMTVFMFLVVTPYKIIISYTVGGMFVVGAKWDIMAGN